MTNATHNIKTTTKSAGVPPTPPEAHQQAGVKSKPARRTSEKKDLKQDITNKIIELMEAGPGAWKKTWEVAANNGFPINATTGAAYRGINILLLWMAGVNAGYTSNKWMTFKQAQAVGANVRKGEKSVTCVFFDMIKKKDPQEGESEFFPMAKAFHLFNLDQIENVPADILDTISDMTPSPFSPDELAEQFLTATGAKIEHRGNKAYYSPSMDKIVLPAPEAFITPANYYATAAHELTHWTGHKSRLDRDFSKTTRFGDESYAFEELVAELGSAFLSGLFGFIDATVENHSSYMSNWLKVLKNDKNAIFTAAKHASAAFDYLNDLTGMTIDKVEA